MSYARIRIPATVVGATGGFNLAMPSEFVEVVGFKATATGDTAARLALVDADSKSVFANAGDIDYTTAKDTIIGMDTTGSGSGGWSPVDSAGNTLAIAGGQGVPARGPIRANWTNGTAGDTLALDLYVRYPLWRQNIVLTGASSNGTMTLRQKFSQITAISAVLTTGTDSDSQLEIRDADARVVYKEASTNRDYSARKNLLLAYDADLTGLTPQHLDGTGVAATATSAAPLPIVRSPLTVLYSGGTADEVLSVDVFYRV
jgi:hypothetical protein